MKREEIGFFGAWALGLLLFIATMIVIRWVIDFVTWTTLDSGWAQAIGSIAALGVAIFVMSRQNKHATKLIVEADLLAARRRGAAVHAVVNRAVAVTQGVRIQLVIPEDVAIDPVIYATKFRSSLRSIKGVVDTLRAIPAYELGSYDMAEGLHLIAVNMEILANFCEQMAALPADYISRVDPKFFDAAEKYITDARDQFRRGFNTLQ